jgi:HNH endonuclease
MHKKRGSIPERFWPKVDKSGGSDACWPWIAYRNPKSGYGQMTNGRGVLLLAHRVAWELTNGEIPDGKFVCHSCDNRPCCNPSHLWIGTNRDNILDAIKKGRTIKPPVHYGVDHPLTTITNYDVICIRAACEQGVSNRIIAIRYGISEKTVINIKKRRTWGHIK